MATTMSETSKPKAVSDLGSISHYESKYTRQEPVVNTKYEGFLRQPRYGTYRSNLVENFGSREIRDKFASDDQFKTLTQSKDTKDKSLAQSYSATFTR